MGGRCLGWLLELGSEGNLGTHRLAELRSPVAHAVDEGAVRGTVSARWALVGLVVTTFAFLGVNMFLSGLHSYGSL